MDPSFESLVERFVHTLLFTGAWLDEVVLGLSAKLPRRSYHGELPWDVVFEMLCGTIGTALQSADRHELELATELIDRASASVEEHLRLADELSGRTRADGDGNRRTDGYP